MNICFVTLAKTKKYFISLFGRKASQIRRLIISWFEISKVNVCSFQNIGYNLKATYFYTDCFHQLEHITCCP